jgi:hypothetical protein
MSQESPPTSQFKAAWVIFFILGVFMLNFPFIHIFNKSTTFFGIPLLILYFSIGWPASIMVVYLFTRRFERDKDTCSIKQGGKEE